MRYHLIRSNRRTIAIRIARDGTVEVRCPLWMTEEAVARFVADKQSWIQKHLPDPTPPAYKLTQEQLEDLKEQASSVITARVAHFASRMGVTWGRITIRHQHSRWGSCSAKGNLNFNCLLMLAPTEVLDYVVVHELCHRREMNHSGRFWAEVARWCPDYQKNRQWLKKNGAALIARLP